jgi:hypothetical protein
MKKILFNPFEQFSERPLILFGIAATVILSMTAAFFNARFDGVLDLHFLTPTLFINTLTDNIINISVLCLTLFSLGKIRNNKTRFVDVFSACLIARIPYYLVPFFNWNNRILLESEKILKQFMTLQPGMTPEFESNQILLLGLFTVVSMLFLTWFIYLLYRGYQVATNAKGTVEVILFGLALLVAEAFSKFIFYILN